MTSMLETLFSNEADGPLDPERKPMFMAMKREVLRIGGYTREFFVSQTPELAAMADVLIDLEPFRERVARGGNLVDLKVGKSADGPAPGGTGAQHPAGAAKGQANDLRALQRALLR